MSIEIKQASETVEKIITQINTTHGKLKTLVLEAYNQLLTEGFTEVEAKDYLKENCKNVGKTTLYNALPDESKDETKSKAGKTRYTSSVPPAEQKESQENKTNDVKITTTPPVQDAQIVTADVQKQIDKAAKAEGINPDPDEPTEHEKLERDNYSLKENLSLANQKLDIQIQKNAELQDAIKQSSFKKGSDIKPTKIQTYEDFPQPDSTNVFVYNNMTFSQMRLEAAKDSQRFGNKKMDWIGLVRVDK